MYPGSGEGEKPVRASLSPDESYSNRSYVTVQVLPFSSLSNSRISPPSFIQNSLDQVLSPDKDRRAQPLRTL